MKEVYFLIGRPLSHSFSADYFNRKFADEGIDAHYFLHELTDISELPSLVERYGEALRGFNVTAPFKKSVLPYLSRLTPEATEAGSVNCVRRDKDGALTGHNTDIAGFLSLLEESAPWPLENKKALVIGGGGVVGAVIAALRKRKIKPVVTVRTPEKFLREYPDFEGEVKEIASLGKDDILDVDLIINCTPLGTFPNVRTAPDIPYEYVQPRHLCLDLVYNPEHTTFTRICAAHGATVASGLPMLLKQAEEGWSFWNDNPIA